MNPGDTLSLAVNQLRSDTLNEGRGMNPGDTLPEFHHLRMGGVRSTKAGG